MAAPFNPFARSKMKIVEPVQLVSCEFNGWDSLYKLEYRASRSAANMGLLAKQFKCGTPLVVHGKHVVVRNADFTVTNGAVAEVTVRVTALDFEAVLNGALANPDAQIVGVTPGSTVAAGDPLYVAPSKPRIPAPSFGPTKRKILA
jgi:hypothetical protein